ncbi:hypothetical protein [Haloferax sp. DFSO52]|uniref:hypothetical protein n=1 Tax=Haloferax sp. DFSO52 TaxID=3388505 RepID=UPI003A86E640
MRLEFRWWHLICASVFSGFYAVPILGFVLYYVSLVFSITAQSRAPSSTDPGVVFILVLFGVALVIAIPGLALALSRDARDSAADEWQPSPRRYGVLGLLYPISLVVAGLYLYRRYDAVGIGNLPVETPLSRGELVTSRWWYSLAIGPLLFLAGFSMFVVPFGATLTFVEHNALRIAGFSLLTGTGVVLFTFGLAADLKAVRGSTLEWTPGTRRYVLPSILVLGLVPVVAAIYLFNRHRHVGVP